MAYCEQWAAHWPDPQNQQIAYGVCQAESGDNPSAIGDNGNSRGLGQIYGPAHPEFAGWNLFDPEQNAQASLQIWQASGWNAWSTYKNGAYLAFAGGAPPPLAAPGLPLQLVDPTTGALSPRVLLIAAAIAAVYLLVRS